MNVTRGPEEDTLQRSQGKPKDGIKDMEKIGLLNGDHEIVLEEGFLCRVIDACNSYFELIAASVDAKETQPCKRMRLRALTGTRVDSERRQRGLHQSRLSPALFSNST
jgi:hypothetical protein